MLTIDRLSLTLPAGFEDRAAAIAEIVARRLATLTLEKGASLDRFQVEYRPVDSIPTADGIAAHVADTVQRRIAGAE